MARVALVTGGSRGIGAAISERLKAEGRTVVANYGGNDAAAHAFTERTGIPCYKFDVSDYATCEAAIKKIETEVGPIEILVNNAGITRDSTMKRAVAADVGRRDRYQSRLLLQSLQAGLGRHDRRGSSAASSISARSTARPGSMAR